MFFFIYKGSDFSHGQAATTFHLSKATHNQLDKSKRCSANVFKSKVNDPKHTRRDNLRGAIAVLTFQTTLYKLKFFSPNNITNERILSPQF